MGEKNKPLSAALVQRRLRENGWLWLIRATAGFLNRKLVPEIFKVSWFNARELFAPHIHRNDGVLYAFYDLSVYGFSYDFIVYLLLADSYRAKNKLTSIHIIFVPGRDGKFRSAPAETNDLGEVNLLWRLRNLLVPSCWLLPSCDGVTVCSSRDEAIAIRRYIARHIYPAGYVDGFSRKRDAGVYLVKDYNHGLPLPQLQATIAAKYYVRQWIETRAQGRKVVTITLRESTYSKERNSNVKAWVEFIHSIDLTVYYPIVVRDTERAMGGSISGLSDNQNFSDVCWNVDLRLALYELSYVNMMVNNGPGALVIFGTRIPYLYFKVLTPQFRSTSEDFFRTYIGVEPGQAFPWSTKWQRWIWEDDSLPVLTREFEKMCADIEAAIQPGDD